MSDLTLIHSLREPAAFPHAVTSVEVHETHISWVVLAGPFAYKIKKPVNLGFCDFTSLADRRFYCEEELRLNRRLAPQLYLDVLPICGTEDSPKIGGSGPPLEWCVRMRQFDQDCLLSRLIDRGSLQAEQIDALARQVAEFHASIPSAGDESPFGTSAAVAEPIRANFAHLAQLESPVDCQLVDRLQAWCERELRRLDNVLAERKRARFVRECHGDMHLGNMFLEGDAITIFDCIEFNESLRWIDVMSEVAFCTMDLADRGRFDFAWRFLNAVLEWSGDYEGLRVFPLYFTYRALVRAKVARIRWNQAGLRADEKSRTSVALAKYLQLAAQALERRPQFLAITHGLSGSGKTLGTQAILEQCGAVRLRSDVERKRLAGLSPLASTGSEVAGGLYAPAFSRRTFARLADLATAVIESGLPVILDATFLRRSDREQFRALSESLAVPFVILDFPTDEATCRERIRQRSREQSDASEATEPVLDRQLRLQEALSDAEQQVAEQFDAARPLAFQSRIGRL